jgi:hypothetical protein
MRSSASEETKMPGEDIYSWSVTAASNGTADSSINWQEGQPRASVNDSARSMMASHAKDRNLRGGRITTAGTANAQTFSSGMLTPYTTVPTGFNVTLLIGLTNTGATTLSMDGIAPAAVKNQRGADLQANELITGSLVNFLYDGTYWRATNGRDSTITGASLFLSKPVATNSCAIYGQLGALNRWVLLLGDSTNETGSPVNTGSNFAVYRYSDAGAYIDAPLGILRTTGQMQLSYPPQINQPVGGYAYVEYNGPDNHTWRAGLWPDGTFVFSHVTTSNVPIVIYDSGIKYSSLGGANYIGFRYGAVTAGYVDVVVDGSFSYALQNVSDERLKQDITPARFDCLSAVLAMPLFEYRWRDHGSAPLVPTGLVAQRLYEIAPHCVIKGDDRPEIKKQENGSPQQAWSIDTNNTIATLIGAIQQLTARIAELETRLAHR